MCFITNTDGLHPSSHQGSNGCDMIEMVHDEPFHLNHQTVTPKYPINRDVLPICKAFEKESIQLM